MAYYMNDLYEGRLQQRGGTDRETEHYSWYGAVDTDLTDQLTFRVEARYTNEDNQVTGTLQTPCINGELPLSFYGDGPIPDGANPCDNVNQPLNPLQVANGGQATGPSNVIVCGQVGRCDALGIASISGSPYYAGNNPNNPQFGTFDGPSWWAFGFLPAPGVQQTLKRTDNYWAPKATLEYAWNNEVMTYFSWARGIKPGGFSLLTSGAFGLDANLDGDYDEIEFEPETLDVWEIGAKTTLFDGRVRLNGSMFYQDFKDKQVTVQKVTGGTTGTEVENISGAEIKGIELDATWQVNENWLVSGGYTFLDSEYTDYTITTQSSGDIARINGGELERAPRNAWIANVSYTNNLFDTGLEWYGEANYRYQDSRWMEAFNVVQFPSYSLTDLRFGILADRWDVQLYVTNVFDDDTVISGGPNPGIATGNFGFGFSLPPSFAQGGPGINAGPKLPSDIYANMPDPRIIGINAKFRFGG
jgi:outer membrane receptor protein involved in Fe transport